MNKALHALVYVILAVAGVALFFEIKLFDKKELLTERNDQLIQSLIDVAGTVEEANAPKPTSQPEARKDVSPIEAKAIETPDTENVLDEYHSELEAGNNKTLQWDGKRAQLRVLYQLDGEGNKIPDPGRPGQHNGAPAHEVPERLTPFTFPDAHKQKLRPAAAVYFGNRPEFVLIGHIRLVEHNRTADSLLRRFDQEAVKKDQIRIGIAHGKEDHGQVHIGDGRSYEFIFARQDLFDMALPLFFADHFQLSQVTDQRFQVLLPEYASCPAFINTGFRYIYVVESGNCFYYLSLHTDQSGSSNVTGHVTRGSYSSPTCSYR